MSFHQLTVPLRALPVRVPVNFTDQYQEFSVPVSRSSFKFAAAVLIAAPLALAACGSGDKAEEQAASASTVTSQATPASKSSVTSSSSETSSASDGTTDPSAASDGAEPRQQGSAADGGSVPTLENPFENGDIEVAQPDPVQGRPATAEESAAIAGLVNGLYEQQTLHGFMRYMPDHTCAATLEAQGGAAAYNLDGIPDMPMNQMPGYSETRVTAVENQTVTEAGDRASATVTVQGADGPSTGTMVFQHEGGNWKFCS